MCFRIYASFSGYHLLKIAINHVRLTRLEGQTLPRVLLKPLSCVTHGNKLIITVKLGGAQNLQAQSSGVSKSFQHGRCKLGGNHKNPTLWNHSKNLNNKLNSYQCFNKHHSFTMCKWGYNSMHSLYRFSSVSYSESLQFESRLEHQLSSDF